VKIKNKKNLSRGVFFAWHQDIASVAALMANKKTRTKHAMHSVVSPSRDGKLLGSIAEKFGIPILYGSSHKNPVSLVRKALKVLKEEKKIFLIGDGSRGPAKKLKPGIEYLAKKSNLPIVFIKCDVQWKITLRSWDQFQIPLPFSKIEIETKLYTHRNPMGKACLYK